jgi:hypothetical protein
LPIAPAKCATAGHFHRHRDNDNVGAQHRRFAVTINLNHDYEGGDLVFPEFGRRLDRAPMGGAVVFSCGALHQVMPVTKGRRFAFLAFLYGEADAALREENTPSFTAMPRTMYPVPTFCFPMLAMFRWPASLRRAPRASLRAEAPFDQKRFCAARYCAPSHALKTASPS